MKAVPRLNVKLKSESECVGLVTPCRSGRLPSGTEGTHGASGLQMPQQRRNEQGSLYLPAGHWQSTKKRRTQIASLLQEACTCSLYWSRKVVRRGVKVAAVIVVAHPSSPQLVPKSPPPASTTAGSAGQGALGLQCRRTFAAAITNLRCC